MRPKKVLEKRVSRYIKVHKVVKISELITHFDCSAPTIFRKLKGREYLTSYNFDRQFLTFSNIPVFDRNGLWEYRGARFSRHGGVRPTVEHIVNKSNDGVSAGEINEILHLRVNNQLRQCVKEERIIRKRYGRLQIYFSSDKSIQKLQIEKRKKLTPIHVPVIKKDMIIKILVTIIRSHETNIEKLLPILHNEGIDANEKIVKWVFDNYEIAKKGYP